MRTLISQVVNENMCTYSTASGTSGDLLSNPGDHGVTRVAPSNGTNHPMNSTDRTYFSVFDILSVNRWQHRQRNSQRMCPLVLHPRLAAKLDYGSSTHGTRYRFTDIPTTFNINNSTAYAVTQEDITVLRDFMSSLTTGTVTINANVLTTPWTGSKQCGMTPPTSTPG